VVKEPGEEGVCGKRMMEASMELCKELMDGGLGAWKGEVGGEVARREGVG